MKSTIKTKEVKLVNPLNHEVWICPDYTKVTAVEGVEYVTVYKPGNEVRKNLMRKDALRKLSNS